MNDKNKRSKVENILFQLRKSHKMTQEELATKLNVTRQTIISIEKGQYIPSLLLALKIAKVFNLPVEQIFSYEE
ncbi:helix-turn-helix transcriptional regulator [Candidatus Dojkabacteria bacterium]|uniref:Helix-turn-helix transcriptional regulator n=1 Tax=Candidatus Dojkabacteria bacterium TaxID=2099670 RepID=A0A955IAH6_9BACT|nr:helix-turn-helix transcriptional regulator [Candidatus Dojkabacteria bacterium]